MEDIAMRIQALKKVREEAVATLNQLEGRQKQLLSSLEADFGCVSLEEAEERIAILQKDIDRRQSRLEKLVADMENALSETGEGKNG